jgi:hypothetical protein
MDTVWNLQKLYELKRDDLEREARLHRTARQMSRQASKERRLPFWTLLLSIIFGSAH